MMKKLLISLTFALSLLVPAVYAHAQATKVGVVNLDRLLNESKIAQSSQTKLQNEFSGRQSSLEAQEKKLQEMVQAYRKDEPTLSETNKKSRIEVIRVAEEKLASAANDFQKDLNERRAQEMQALLDKINEAVKRVATSEKYDLILTEAAYAKPEHDITQKVLDILNK
ncbi:MAG: OmpH family outer membrane protein [Saezia sp.]